MANFGDDHAFTVKAIANQVGANEREFATTLTNRSPALGQVRERLSGSQQSGSEPLGGERIELCDIVADLSKIGRGAARQDYSNQAAGGS